MRILGTLVLMLVACDGRNETARDHGEVDMLGEVVQEDVPPTEEPVSTVDDIPSDELPAEEPVDGQLTLDTEMGVPIWVVLDTMEIGEGEADLLTGDLVLHVQRERGGTRAYVGRIEGADMCRYDRGATDVSEVLQTRCGLEAVAECIPTASYTAGFVAGDGVTVEFEELQLEELHLNAFRVTDRLGNNYAVVFTPGEFEHPDDPDDPGLFTLDVDIAALP